MRALVWYIDLNLISTMATVVVGVFLLFLCFDVIFGAAAVRNVPNNADSEFYNDIRQLLELRSAYHQKVFNLQYLIVNSI